MALGDPASRLSLGERIALYAQVAWPRALPAYALTITHPAFAHAFAGDAAMAHRFAAIFARTAPGPLCDGALAPRIAKGGVGHYANQLMTTVHGRFDPRSRLRRVRDPARPARRVRLRAARERQRPRGRDSRRRARRDPRRRSPALRRASRAPSSSCAGSCGACRERGP